MNWLEASVDSNPDEIQELTDRLTELGIEGFSIEDEQDFRKFLEENRPYWNYVDEELLDRFRGVSRVKFYLEENAQNRSKLREIGQKLGKEIAVSVLAEEDWENNWKAYYEPIPIGNRLLIVPDWLEPDTGNRVPLRLEPGLAFGTGSHATTKMCLEVLDGMHLEGASVLDLGCGSGILGLAALRLGCVSVKGCDIDPKARDAALDNAQRNHIAPEQCQIYVGDVIRDSSLRRKLAGKYDLILANIVADVVLPICGFVTDFLQPEGRFLCSGIIDGREAEVEAALCSNGFQIIRHLHQAEWHCLLAGR